VEAYEVSKKLHSGTDILESIEHKLNIDVLKGRLQILNSQLVDSSFWDDSKKAIKITKEISDINSKLDEFSRLTDKLNSINDLLKIIDLLNSDDNILLTEELETFLVELDSFETKVLLSEPYDINNCYIKIQPGEGGTESMDWALMLFRMYNRFSKIQSFGFEIEEYNASDEAGIKSALILIKGEYAFGYLRGERGVHRLIRLSPFNSLGKRMTSFCSINVFPFIEDDDEEIIIKDTDVRVDVFRSGGAGAQSVNTTDSAVRITHLSTGIVISIQNERSQLQNKEKAFSILRGMLLQRRMDERKEKIDSLKGSSVNIGFGSQIRTYTFHPYQMVKDHRSNLEISDIYKVMDGELMPLVRGYLRRSDGGKSED
jgi:peptide chain release factor 2